MDDNNRNNKINQIARNTSYFTVALIMQKIISFTYFTVLARNLNPEDLGRYYFAISLTTIFAIFIDLGLANVLTRESAKNQENAGNYLGNIILIKLPLMLFSVLSVIFYVNFLHYPVFTKNLVYIALIPMVLDSFTLSFYALIRGFHNLKYESFGSIIFQLIVFIFGLSALKLGLSLNYVLSALALASIFNFSYSLYFLRFKIKARINLKLNKVLIKKIILIALPFAAYAVFQRMYMYLDTVLLSKLAGDHFVGLYQIAFKIIFSLQFLPMAFVASLYPAFSDYWKNNREQLRITLERAINYLVFISLPISFGIIVLADKILLIFKPEYIEALNALRIIMIAMPFIFINFPIGALLNACDRQKANTRNMGIVLITSIILNLILIPKFNASGAALTVLISNFLMFILGILIIPSISKINLRKILIPGIKAFASVLIMSLLIYFLNLNLILSILMGAIIYFGFMIILRAIKKEDIESLISAFR
jgi:O-antigen/teichoic acid export membrane protein